MESGAISRTKPNRDLAALDDSAILDLARAQFAELQARLHTSPSELGITRAPRIRRFGRRLWDVGSKVLDLIEIVGRFLINPHHIPGRWLARLRLLAPTKTFNLWLLGMTIFAIVLGFATFLPFRELPHFMQTKADWRKGAAVAVMGSLFTGTVVGLLALLWNDLFRCPYLMRQICHQVRRRPDCVLLNNIGPRAVNLVPHEEPIRIVPRTHLYDELTPGVLQRKRKDVQIVVGDPGAGKTTALIGIAEALAKLGIVPVLIPLRATAEVNLVELGKERLRKQVQDYTRSDTQFEQLWRWLYQRRRVALVTDDLDRLSPDGERGFMLRTALKEAGTVDLPIIVTARPAGVPAGIAASAIDLGPLDEGRAVECITEGARNDPSFRKASEVSAESLLNWIRSGNLTEVPYYLELLAQLAAAGKDTFPELPEPWTNTMPIDQRGLVKTEPDGRATWNPWWVHALLLDHYYREVCAGNVARWKGIEPRERRSTMHALEYAALGVLLSQAVSARAKGMPHDERERNMPERTTIEEFLPTDDRDDRDLEPEDPDRQGGRPPEAPEAEQGGLRIQPKQRPRTSAQEVIETAENLRILDRDAANLPQFRHRITQAYLAGRRLAELEVGRHTKTGDNHDEWIDMLVDRRHPEKLTAHTALTFAALRAERLRRRAQLKQDRVEGHSAEEWDAVGQRILRRLVAGAAESLEPVSTDGHPPRSSAVLSTLSAVVRGQTGENQRRTACANVDPTALPDPETRRDPDDALIKLTTAADIASALATETADSNRDNGPSGEWACPPRPERYDHRITQCDILALVKASGFVTRWTKLNAINAIAALEVPDRWRLIWQFARDPDFAVRQAASIALERDAWRAYRALRRDIDHLIMRAAARSSRDQDIERATVSEGTKKPDDAGAYYIGAWWPDDVLGLEALGTVLPAIVSGLQEDPGAVRVMAEWQGRNGADDDGLSLQAMDGDGVVSADQRGHYVHEASESLDHLVALAFEGEHHVLERMVAQGFRADAMRHATGEVETSGEADRPHAGPGWVAAHARLVVTVGLCHAEHWYAQLMLGQALALYMIAGASRQTSYDVLARCLHRGGAHRHPFTQRALRLGRTAVRRHSVHSSRWSAFIWDDELTVSSKRPVSLTHRTAQLLGDVTLLLDLSEGAPEHKLDAAAHMDELPYCLHQSRDRREILGTGCPSECGWSLCPYKQPPPDEPNEHHGVSRAFCRQQRWIARHHVPPWQRRIRRHRLADFWREMERRART